MKHSSHSLAFLMLIVYLVISNTAAVQGGEADMEVGKESVSKMEGFDSFYKLMGLEECGEEDAECLKRRVAAEAHLDYIYTQQHHTP